MCVWGGGGDHDVNVCVHVNVCVNRPGCAYVCIHMCLCLLEHNKEFCKLMIGHISQHYNIIPVSSMKFVNFETTMIHLMTVIH